MVVEGFNIERPLSLATWGNIRVGSSRSGVSRRSLPTPPRSGARRGANSNTMQWTWSPPAKDKAGPSGSREHVKMAFKKPSAPAAVPESPDRLFLDLPKRRHTSLFESPRVWWRL